jgi:phi LC3 family holin
MLIFGGEKMINWKLRLQNKVTLLAILGDIVAIVFSIISLVQTKEFTYESVMHIISLVVEVLVLLGIVVDPTTKGIKDTKLVQSYEEPRDEEVTDAYKVEEIDG